MINLKYVLLLAINIYQVHAQYESCDKNDIKCDYKNNIRQLSHTLASKFHEIVMKELGSEYTNHLEIRSAYKVSWYQSSNDYSILSKITDKLSHKITSATSILMDMKNAIDQNEVSSYTHPCPFKSIGRYIFMRSLSESNNMKSNTLERFKDLKIKRQYFLSHVDYATDKDCTNIPHSNLRYLYHKVVHQESKIVVFIIDNNMKEVSLQHALSVAKEIVHTLQSNDLLVLKITNMTSFMRFEDTCSVDGMANIGNATEGNKLLFYEYLTSIDVSSANVPPLNISTELEILLNESEPLPVNKLFILLTDSKIIDNKEWFHIFPHASMNITKFAVGLVHEDINHKNCTLEILHFDKWHNHSNEHSIMKMHMNNSGVVGQVASAFISLLPTKFEEKLIAEGPLWEATERDFIVSLLYPMKEGVLGLDLYWSDLAEDIIYFKGTNERKRAFVMDFSSKGTVYLSPSCFLSPFTYLYDMGDGQEAINYMQNFLAYIRSVAHGLLSNPGLKDEIQQDVGFLNSLLTFYKRQHIHGSLSRYVIRRYAATESGVLVMYPGTVLEYDYEPVRRPWYIYASENPGKLILSPPTLDVGGAGYVVSLSYSVKSPMYPTMVLAIDVTMGFLYKLLIDNFPVCATTHVKCFIMNDRGYLVSHPGLMDPKSSGPIEQQHITHKESMIAIDMLNHKGFVTKRLCNNFFDKTIQRYYEFNTSLPNVLSNVVSGDHCVHYYIAAIPGTNTFISVVNVSCSVGRFCPCSMVDRLCLNCNRMEQTECECPCECSSESYGCPNSNMSFNKNIPLCGMIPENNNHKSHYFHNVAENLKSCFDFQCETYVTYDTCLGVMGCEWCQIDMDGQTPLISPFCTLQSTCFNGVLGAVTPYGEGTFGHINRDAFASYSAIGPIAGCFVTVSLIIAVAIYCYRQNTSSVSCHNLYVDGPAETWHDAEVQMSHLQDDMPDPSGQDKLLPMEIEAPISPYRVITGYRRPHTAGGSDHGYSTMTPHEDSEATGFSVNDPTILSDDTKSDVSFPAPAKIKPRANMSTDFSITVLPCGKNSVIAPVTVHRHMEAS
ncbi:unnamed protein product [Leptidea sinapis]|uniref:VWFA domain-containing protein n=1 Tax=Leptidea sinapis TaxID=189913 RepID=A0A5E4R823_9NEOP|nr:unnamed protein product [Leptidea sinapis]